MESKVECAEKYLMLQKEHNQTLKNAIATEIKCKELNTKVKIQEAAIELLAEKYQQLKERFEKIAQEHADLNVALAAMLNGYQNLSMYQKDWFTVPKDLIDTYTKMVLEYDRSATEQTKEEKEVELSCMVCGTKFMGPEPQMCCSGRDCGCMGLPVDPIVCSKECYKKGIPLQKGDSGVPVEVKEGNKEREVLFGDWLRTQRPDIFHGCPTTEQLWNEWNNQQNQ